MTAPTTYTVIDTETSHYHNPFVLQMGFCQVRDREVVETSSFNIVPPPDVDIKPGAIKIHGLSREVLEKIGMPHMDVLPMIRETIEFFGDNWMMGQNFKFDTKALNYTLKYAGLEELDFDKMKFIDVGVTFKAFRLMNEWNWGDRAKRPFGKSLNDYFKYISAQRTQGLKWNIDFCMEWFEIDASKRADHNAGEDCRLTHLIYDAMFQKGIIQEMLFSAQ